MIDNCSEPGALQLARRIEDYWRARGWGVETRLVHGHHTSNRDYARYDVRSDLVNGFPAGLAREIASKTRFRLAVDNTFTPSAQLCGVVNDGGQDGRCKETNSPREEESREEDRQAQIGASY